MAAEKWSSRLTSDGSGLDPAVVKLLFLNTDEADPALQNQLFTIDTLAEVMGAVTGANNGLSVSGSTVQLGQAAAGSGLSDFTANRYLFTAGFLLQIGGTANNTIFSINGNSGVVATTYDFYANNVLVGLGAGSVATNTVVGYDALSANSTGTTSCAFGYQALKNSTNNSNSAFGYQALKTNSSAVGNCAFGTSALTANSTGGGNSAFGSAALSTNSTATNNSSFGASSLYNSNSNNNSAFGVESGYSLTSGSSNNLFGYRALRNNNTGSQNVVMGTDAGYNSGVGTMAVSGNILIGHQVGNNITNGANYNIIIGYGIYLPSSSSSNQLSIGNLIYGYGVDGTLATTSTGGVGIGGLGDPKAILNLVSTTKGLLLPRLTTTQKNAISSPPAGLMVYDTTLAKLCVYTTAWETITST